MSFVARRGVYLIMGTSQLMPTTEPRTLVLVADDEQALQDLLTSAIQRLGLVVICVGDGATAIAAVKTHRVKLLCAIMDIVMPVVNGVDAAHAIEAIAPDLPIVLMSGAIPLQYTDSIKRLHLAGMLHKPFPLAALREFIRHAVDEGVAIEVQRRQVGL